MRRRWAFLSLIAVVILALNTPGVSQDTKHLKVTDKALDQIPSAKATTSLIRPCR